MAKATPINEKLSQELIVAVIENNEEKVQQLLLLDNVDVNIQDENGEAPLHHACKYGFEGCVKLLLASDDINVNSQDKQGYSCLHNLCWNEHDDLFALLFARPEIDVNIANLYGETPLYLVCLMGRPDKVSLFLKIPEIDISICDNKSKTLLDDVKKRYKKDKGKADADGNDRFDDEEYIEIIDMLENFKPVERFLSSEKQKKLSALSPNDIKMPKNKEFLDACVLEGGLSQIFVGLTYKQQSALLGVYSSKIRRNDKICESIGQIVYDTHKGEKEKKRQANGSQIKEALCQNQRQ